MRPASIWCSSTRTGSSRCTTTSERFPLLLTFTNFGEKSIRNQREISKKFIKKVIWRCRLHWKLELSIFFLIYYFFSVLWKSMLRLPLFGDQNLLSVLFLQIKWAKKEGCPERSPNNNIFMTWNQWENKINRSFPQPHSVSIIYFLILLDLST